MRRALIVLMVCVLVIGGIGAALATGMDFSNVGALSLARHSVPPQVIADSVTLNQSGDYVVSVTLSFNSDLGAGSQIHVALLDSGENVIDQGRTGDTGLGSDLGAAGSVTIDMEGGDQTPESIDEEKTEVTVLPSFVP